MAAPAQAVNRWRVVKPYNNSSRPSPSASPTGRWGINTGNGFYGGLQLTLSTWRVVGGRGLPHRATKLEQQLRAVLLIRREGYTPWPVCGSRV